MADITEIRELAGQLNDAATALQTIVHTQLEKEDELMSPAQMNDAILRIGELTIATVGLAIGQLIATAEQTGDQLDSE